MHEFYRVLPCIPEIFAQFALAYEYWVMSLVSQYSSLGGVASKGASSLNIPQFAVAHEYWVMLLFLILFSL